jgi:hypothetical protein
MAQGFTLITGLNDLSAELGESTTNTTTKRITSFNHAVVMFSEEKKWKFLVKKNTTLTTVNGTKSYALPAGMSDRRMPNGIRAIYIGTSTIPVDPQKYSLDEDEVNLLFEDAPAETGLTITIYYYYIPARLTDTTDVATLIPIPDSKRKIIATLAAAFVQWSRYLDAQGNRFFNLYQKLVVGATGQQSEQNTGNPKRAKHYLQRIGFRRTYP